MARWQLHGSRLLSVKIRWIGSSATSYMKLQSTCVDKYLTQPNVIHSLTISCWLLTYSCPPSSTSSLFVRLSLSLLFFSGFSLGGLSTQYTICHTQQLCRTNIQTPIIAFTFFPKITLLLCWQLFQVHNMYITYDSSNKINK